MVNIKIVLAFLLCVFCFCGCARLFNMINPPEKKQKSIVSPYRCGILENASTGERVIYVGYYKKLTETGIFIYSEPVEKEGDTITIAIYNEEPVTTILNLTGPENKIYFSEKRQGNTGWNVFLAQNDEMKEGSYEFEIITDDINRGKFPLKIIKKKKQ